MEETTTVKELIKELKTYDSSLKIVIQTATAQNVYPLNFKLSHTSLLQTSRYKEGVIDEKVVLMIENVDSEMLSNLFERPKGDIQRKYDDLKRKYDEIKGIVKE